VVPEDPSVLEYLGHRGHPECLVHLGDLSPLLGRLEILLAHKYVNPLPSNRIVVVVPGKRTTMVADVEVRHVNELVLAG
jgi:hypothetical protein